MRETPDEPISLRLVSTLHGRFADQPADDLDSVDSVTTWLKSRGITPLATLDATTLTDLATLREAIFSMFGSLTSPDTPFDRHSVAVINASVDRAAMTEHLVLAPDGSHVTVEQNPPEYSTDHIVHLIAADALTIITTTTGERLKQCAADTCGSFFLDTSRAGNRKWCTSATCGNRNRVTAHRARTRTAGTN